MREHAAVFEALPSLLVRLLEAHRA